MKALKWSGFALSAYVGLVVLVTSMLGTVQPGPGGTLVIETAEADGTTHERVVFRLESGGDMYISANNWPRAWYRRALENPDVRVTIEGTTADYVAVPVSGDEHDRVNADNSLSPVLRLLTGFPPRSIVRLDPR